MTSLETTRGVNDALQNADFTTVFALLNAEPEMRPSELPTLEQKSLKALAKALKVPENAQIWADALFDDAASVRLFAAKILLRLRDAAKPVAAPLQNKILKDWEYMVPVPQNQWQAYGQYHEILSRAVEILFCADTEGALQFCDEQLKKHMAATRACAEQFLLYELRRQAAYDAVNKAVAEIALEEHGIRERWGINSLPTKISGEIFQRVRARPDIIALHENIGDDPATKSNRVFPMGVFSGAIHRLAKSKAQPQKSVLEQLREPLWAYVEAGLKPNGDDEAAFAQQLLSFGSMPNGAGLFPDSFFLQRAPQLLAAVREDADAEAILNKMDDNISSAAYPSQLRLWAWLALALVNAFERDKKAHPDAWPAEKALPLLRSVWLKNNRVFHLHRRVQGAAAQYGGLDQPQKAIDRSVTPPVETTRLNVQEKKDLMNAHLKETQVKAAQVGSFEIARHEDEDAIDFLQRASDEHKAYLEKLQDAFDIARGNYNPQYGLSYQEAAAKLKAAVWSLSDEEKWLVFLNFTGDSQETCFSDTAKQYLFEWLNQAPTNEDGEHFLHPIETQLWANCEQAIRDIAEEQKRSSWSESATLKNARSRFHNSKMLLLSIHGNEVQFKILQVASRLRARTLARQLEDEILIYHLNASPKSDSREDWIAWKLDESNDPFLEHLAQIASKRRGESRSRAYSYLATGFYRRFTSETRQQCWEMAALSNGITQVLFQAIMVYRDEDTWLATLQSTPKMDQRFHRFFESQFL